METTKWYVSIVHRLNAGMPLYNAIRFVGGKCQESIQTPTHSETVARRHADQLNALSKRLGVK